MNSVSAGAVGVAYVIAVGDGEGLRPRVSSGPTQHSCSEHGSAGDASERTVQISTYTSIIILPYLCLAAVKARKNGYVRGPLVAQLGATKVVEIAMVPRFEKSLTRGRSGAVGAHAKPRWRSNLVRRAYDVGSLWAFGGSSGRR